MIKIQEERGDPGFDLPGCRTCKEYSTRLNSYMDGLLNRRDYDSFTDLRFSIDEVNDEIQRMTPDEKKILKPYCPKCAFSPGLSNSAETITILRDWIKRTEKELLGIPDSKKKDYVADEFFPVYYQMHEQAMKTKRELWDKSQSRKKMRNP